MENETDEEKNKKKLKQIILDMIDNGIIDEQYKKYFYNFPKGTKIYNTVEKKVADILNINFSINENNIIEINQLVKKVSEDFLKEKLENILLLGKNFPKVVLCDNNLLKVAKNINNEKIFAICMFFLLSTISLTILIFFCSFIFNFIFVVFFTLVDYYVTLRHFHKLLLKTLS